MHTLNVDRSNKRKWLYSKKRKGKKKAWSRWYPAETMTDYPDNLVVLANTPAQAESLLHSLEQAAGDIGLHLNANKPEYNMCFKWEGATSTPSGRPLKLGNKFIYLSNNSSSTESDVNIHVAKVWTAIERLSFI